MVGELVDSLTKGEEGSVRHPPKTVVRKLDASRRGGETFDRGYVIILDL